jgi:hypothetical protein
MLFLIIFMSKLKSSLYCIDYKNGYYDEMSKEMLEESLDDIFNDISKIVKQYRLQNKPKQRYCMTLFTDEHNFTAEEYIEHYNNMPKEEWGQDFLDDFDIEIIQMFN